MALAKVPHIHNGMIVLSSLGCLLLLVTTLFYYNALDFLSFNSGYQTAGIGSPVKKEIGKQAKSSDCKISYGHYAGNLWVKEGETKGKTCLLESERMRVDHHIREIPASKERINDWLWIEYGERVNVLVREKNTDKFFIFEQTKYALEGKSLAIVGGFIEPEETPSNAALREVKEELKMLCDFYHLHSLGRYRTDVNRGLGWVHAFLALDCVTIAANSNIRGENNLPMDADMKQESQLIKKLNIDEVETAVENGKFIETQWTMTVALSILQLRRKETKI